MLNKSKMILVVSDKMDNNKKPNRNEQLLIRCSGPVRQEMSFPGPIVDVKGENDRSRTTFRRRI